MMLVEGDGSDRKLQILFIHQRFCDWTDASVLVIP